jgi:hypothetical protein
MTEDFSVAALAPFRRGHGTLQLGLRPLAGAAWRDRRPPDPARQALKQAILEREGDSLIVRPEAAPAIAELAALLGVPAGDLRAVALAAFEDWLILLPQQGAHVLVAGALAFPTDWHLPEKMGLPLAGIHAPIPRYADRLAAGVDHVFQTLAPDRLLRRANWNLLETDTLRYLPGQPAIDRFGHVTAANAGDTLFLRIERQSLRRLPESGAAVFGIGIYIEPLAALPVTLVQDLARAVAAVPADEAVRRGIPAYGAALAAYAAAL